MDWLPDIETGALALVMMQRGEGGHGSHSSRGLNGRGNSSNPRETRTD